ncbi:MAG: quinoprotein dehydrogenase-associated SoxYZ-like carrier [Gammaproteobacteria bacterium]|nr:quinoprotein dehydrogenase-associated SoxYZ-like carrier [Gammaproteobacteria bacterium]
MTRFILAPLCVAALAWAEPFPTAAAEPGAGVWAQLRTELFGERPIEDGSEVIAVRAPERAANAAIVPVSVEELRPDDDGAPIETLYLIVDNNPEPLSAIVRFGPAAARAQVATRIRINAYTHVRAVAETRAGKLYMASRYVKATGGCSAPAGGAQRAALEHLGEIRLRTWEDARAWGEPRRAQVMIRHPNFSGLQKDQVTGLYRPAHYVDRVRVGYGGETVLEAELTITLSRNPSLRFYYRPAGPGSLVVEASDNEGNRFRKASEVAGAQAKQVRDGAVRQPEGDCRRQAGRAVCQALGG